MSLTLNPLTGKFDVVVKDHGALTNLTDDDHPQYIKETNLDAGLSNTIYGGIGGSPADGGNSLSF